MEQIGFETLLKIVEHSRFTKVTQLVHVLHTIELGRIDSQISLLILGLCLFLLCFEKKKYNVLETVCWIL